MDRPVRRKTPLGAALVAIAVLAGCGGGSEGDSEPAADTRFDQERAFRDLRAQVRFGSRPAGSAANRRLTRFLAERLRRAGAQGVRIQRPHRNVVGRIPGRSRGAVVVGAHHDTKNRISPDFEGANDGASGVAVVLELVRALPGRLDGPSVHIALFDAEETRGDRPFTEDGTRGSRQYVRYARDGRQGAPPLGEVRGMVLFDMVGDCDLQVPLETSSDPDLYGVLQDAAEELDPEGGGAPLVGTRGPVLDDHIPFIEAGVPAVDVIDFTFGPGPSPGRFWHTPEDSLDKVCAESLGAVGRPAVLALPEIR